MTYIDPGTRSPGKLVLVYSYPEVTHKVGVRFIYGVDLGDITAARADATAFANVVKPCLPTGSGSIGSWEIHDPTGGILYAEPFTPAIGGTGTNSPTPFSSTTQTLSGNGVPTTITGARGKTRVVIFPRNAYAPVPGARQTTLVGAGPGWTPLAAWLHSNLRCFADFYGQHAEPKSYVTVQFNARAQRHYGS